MRRLRLPAHPVDGVRLDLRRRRARDRGRRIPGELALLSPSPVTGWGFHFPEAVFQIVPVVGVLYGFTATMFLLSWTAGILFRTWRQSRANRSSRSSPSARS
ncbi:hypothetical protein GCM10025881_04460 [Pseudolysinimonas kribbensis]|uniref:Uncharacterized protein n=1 Tax=Pseudolysinimonas kribbensis TaxID=433641 RepID=A0ABQ6K0Z9_9MICO|nr:hypothetical protein [Pseudolysinimonas kribbensis]GMA93622.1 hypothetical protein GCM10025881_04460 [Pseudolysinimonas kribbensis]